MATQSDQLPSSRRSRRTCRFRRLAGAALITSLALAIATSIWAASASANDLFTLDPAAVSAGHLIEDSAGNAYIGWVDGPSSDEVPKFCKIPRGGTCTDPITLPVPGTKGSNIPNQVIPVFGSGSIVYLVGPDYVDDAVVIWTSTNGGLSFNGGVVDTSGYPDMGEPNTVLLEGLDFWIGTSHDGVGFGLTPTNGSSGSALNFSGIDHPGPYAGDATLGLASAGDPVEAYWEDEDDSPIQFYRYKGSGSVTTESSWAGPALVGEGQAPRLASGAAGLFLLSAGMPTPGGEPELVQVRKYAGTSFGAPLSLLDGPSFDAQAGGAIAESPGGQIAVAWPTGSGQAATMQLFVSTDGGLSFGAAGPIAHIGEGYETGVNAQISLNDNGAGWLTYRDLAGLQVADLSPLTQSSSSGSGTTGSTSSTPPAKTTPKPYVGATTTTTTPVGGELLTLKVPKACLTAEQPFYVGVGKEKRHGIAKQLQTSIKVSKITFSFDGLKKTLKKKPFRWLIKPPALAAGHPYVVKARVSVSVDKDGKTKTVVKTLKGKVSIC